jgi:AhpD family alkylhydroperoxidase
MREQRSGFRRRGTCAILSFCAFGTLAVRHEPSRITDPEVERSMAVVPLIARDQAPMTAQPYYADGDPGPLVAAFAHVPEVLDSIMPFLGTIFGPSSLPARVKQIVVLRTSALQRCRYCIDTHTVVSREAGLDPEEVAALRGELSGSTFQEPAEAALLEWIEVVGGTSDRPEQRTAERMHEHYSEAAIVELTTLVGATLMLNRFATGLALPTSQGTLERLAEEGFVPGPPIDPAE